MISERSRATRWVFLAIILSAYAVMGVAYVWFTPLWEAPDEPAHYNYVRYLIEHPDLPILQQGDYDFAYLERIKAARFPPDMPVDAIRYESHQPPLYYVLGAVLAAPFPEQARPFVLRLFSVCLGLVLLVVVYLVGQEIFPERPAIALGATAFVATAPMHVATTAAINNDTAAELILGLVLLALIRRLIRPPDPRLRAGDLTLGLLLGLGLLTKTTTYVALPLAVVVVLAPSLWSYVSDPLLRARALPWSRTLQSLGRVLLLAFLLAVPWLVRNALVYGGADVLGLIRHNAIMGEQPKTAELLARLGWGGFIQEFALTTFRSFWAQFGWMGVLVDERIYWVLGLLCLLAGVGLALYIVRDAGKLSVEQKMGLALLLLSFLLTLASYLWYNTQFLQHQGRYLFPALIPLGMGCALGLWKLLERRYVLYVAGAMVVAMLVVGLVGRGNRWLVAPLAAVGVFLALRWLLTRVRQEVWYALPFVGLWSLDAVCLFVFIVPYFRR